MPLGRTQAQLNRGAGRAEAAKEERRREADSRGGETNHLLDNVGQYTQSSSIASSLPYFVWIGTGRVVRARLRSETRNVGRIEAWSARTRNRLRGGVFELKCNMWDSYRAP